MTVFSILVDSCEKIWLFWLLTEDNLERLLRSYSLAEYLLNICGHELEYGVLAVTNCAIAVCISSGWIHATEITKGGYLVEVVVYAAEDIIMATRCFMRELQLNMADLSSESAEAYERTLHIVLGAQNLTFLKLVVQGWIEMLQEPL